MRFVCARLSLYNMHRAPNLTMLRVHEWVCFSGHSNWMSNVLQACGDSIVSMIKCHWEYGQVLPTYHVVCVTHR